LRVVADVERTEEFTVEGRLLTDVGGTLGAHVLSTPGMIAMMERTAAVLAAEHLADGRPTVGFEVCVRHVAGAGEGARCTATARLREVLDGRKLRFDVEVREGDRVIGTGTHERRAVARRGPAERDVPEPPSAAARDGLRGS
jgi:predicted thioesterase